MSAKGAHCAWCPSVKSWVSEQTSARVGPIPLTDIRLRNPAPKHVELSGAEAIR